MKAKTSNPEAGAKEKTYTCWECHTPGFLEVELDGHRCKECRKKRQALASGAGRHSPWKTQGQRVWRRTEMGPRAGVLWERRDKTVNKDIAVKQVLQNEKLPTLPEDEE